jgi:hypothetical protein
LVSICRCRRSTLRCQSSKLFTYLGMTQAPNLASMQLWTSPFALLFPA